MPTYRFNFTRKVRQVLRADIKADNAAEAWQAFWNGNYDDEVVNEDIDDESYPGVTDDDGVGVEEPPELTVDGHEFETPDSDLAGDGQFPPFRIFDAKAQDYLEGTYDTRAAAEEAMGRLV